FKNESFISQVLENNYSHIQYIPQGYLTSSIIHWFCYYAGEHTYIIKMLPPSMITKELAQLLVKKNHLHFIDLLEVFQNDIDIYNSVTKIYQKDIFSSSGKNIKSNPYLVTQILEKEPNLYSSIDLSLKSPEFFIRLI